MVSGQPFNSKKSFLPVIKVTKPDDRVKVFDSLVAIHWWIIVADFFILRKCHSGADAVIVLVSSLILIL